VYEKDKSLLDSAGGYAQRESESSLASQVAVNEDEDRRIIEEGANKQRLGDKMHDSSCDRMVRELR
jgi:hypothetical protein